MIDTPSPDPRAVVDHDGILKDLDRDGVAVVRQVLSPRLLAELGEQVGSTLGDRQSPTGSAYDLAFIERSSALVEVLGHLPFITLARRLLGTPEVVVNRSAAILRIPGSPQVGWHSDFDFSDGLASGADAVLNRGEWPGGMWFYLSGCAPEHGGLAVMQGSQVRDWIPPAPWRLSTDRRLLLNAAGEPADMDLPGMLAVRAEPGDLVVFAARTYHAAYPLQGRPRLSCGLGLRPRAVRLDAPWTLLPESRAWRQRLPERMQNFFDGYLGMPATDAELKRSSSAKISKEQISTVNAP
jgi:hypothetical protein